TTSIMPGFLWAKLLDDDGNLLRDHGWLEWKVLGITEHKLECVSPGRQFNARLGLSSAEVQVVLILRDRIIRIERIVDVDQQVMMAAVRELVSRMRNAHVAQSKAAPKCSLDHRAVVRPYEIQIGVIGGRFPLR